MPLALSTFDFPKFPEFPPFPPWPPGVDDKTVNRYLDILEESLAMAEAKYLLVHYSGVDQSILDLSREIRKKYLLKHSSK